MRVFAFLLALSTFGPSAASEFSIAPLRTVISAEQPAAAFRIANPTDRILEVRMSWIDLAATPEGYETATAKQRASLSAAPYLTLKPAYARIEPGGAATVAIALKKGAKPPPGERRSHLLVETGAARTPLRKTFGLELDIGLGVSAPVILRGGSGAAGARIGATRFLRSPEGALLLETSIEPDGAYSAYGRLVADYLAPGQSPKRLGEIRNVSAFTDAKRRVYSIPLNASELPAGRLRVTFAGDEEFKGRVFVAREFVVDAPRK